MSEQSKELAMFSAKRKLKHVLGQQLVALDDKTATCEILEMIKEHHKSMFVDTVQIRLETDHNMVCRSIYLSADNWQTYEVIGFEDERRKLKEFAKMIFISPQGAFAATFIVAAIVLSYFL